MTTACLNNISGWSFALSVLTDRWMLLSVYALVQWASLLGAKNKHGDGYNPVQNGSQQARPVALFIESTSKSYPAALALDLSSLQRPSIIYSSQLIKQYRTDIFDHTQLLRSLWDPKSKIQKFASAGSIIVQNHIDWRELFLKNQATKWETWVIALR